MNPTYQQLQIELKRLEKEKQEQLEAKIYLDRMTALFLEAREDFQALSEQVQDTERRLNVLKRDLSLSDDSFREKLTQERQKWLELRIRSRK